MGLPGGTGYCSDPHVGPLPYNNSNNTVVDYINKNANRLEPSELPTSFTSILQVTISLIKLTKIFGCVQTGLHLR